MSTKFTYFAFGSNLLERRMQFNNPSAIRIAIGKLNNYRLDFMRHSKRWHGCTATIVPHHGFDVWGTLWEIDLKDLPSLDIQEGVHQSIYRRFLINAELPDGSVKECYVYEQVEKPQMYFKLRELPSERQPSQRYRDTIIKGAEESNLPQHYQKLVQGITCNSFNGDVDLNLVE